MPSSIRLHPKLSWINLKPKAWHIKVQRDAVALTVCPLESRPRDLARSLLCFWAGQIILTMPLSTYHTRLRADHHGNLSNYWKKGGGGFGVDLWWTSIISKGEGWGREQYFQLLYATKIRITPSWMSLLALPEQKN